MPRWLQVLLAVVVVVLLVTGGLLLWRQSLPLPEASLDGAPAPLGRSKRTVSLSLSAPAGKLTSVEAKLLQGGTEKLSTSADLVAQDASALTWPLEVDAGELGLTEGPVELRVFLKDDQWRPKPDPAPRLVGTLEVDLTPPRLDFVSATKYIKHAGTGVAAYRVEGAERSGVRAGGREFPGRKGVSADESLRVVLFTIPYDQPRAEPVLFAEDAAGNVRQSAVPVTFLDAEFQRDRFELKPEFMASKVMELTPSADASSPEKVLESYLAINRDMRAQNEKTIREAASGASEVAPLWSGSFQQQPNSKVFAYFPQQRDSLVNGEVVDTQWHLGLDLASTERVPVLAANTGKVLFAQDNGIYGNTVILDHGLGLTTLYSHLSSISVGLGQLVNKGEPVGISGKSGLAGGDHLHFAMLVGGTYTNPIDWFDAGYIHDRIGMPLADAGLSLPGVTDLSAPVRGKPAPKKAAKAEGKKRGR